MRYCLLLGCILLLGLSTRAAPDTLSIYFAPGIDTLDPALRQEIDHILPQLKKSGIISIYGYADQSGLPDRNIALAAQRADKVKRYLRVQAIPEALINIQETQVVSRASVNKDLYRKDRRVDIVYSRSALPLTLKFQFNGNGFIDSSQSKYRLALSLLQQDPGLKITLTAFSPCPFCDRRNMSPECERRFENNIAADLRLQTLYQAFIARGIDSTRLSRVKAYVHFGCGVGDSALLVKQQKVTISRSRLASDSTNPGPLSPRPPRYEKGVLIKWTY